jgi:hypothetical protein
VTRESTWKGVGAVRQDRDRVFEGEKQMKQQANRKMSNRRKQEFDG